jgi:hypothetical protein
MIEYRGVEYPTRELDMGPEIGIVTVATLALQKALMYDSDDQIEGDKETGIDEMIYWYCNEIEWGLPDEKLAAYIQFVG